MRPITTIQVHHSAGPLHQTADDIRRYHTRAAPAGRGWSDIGYHYVVEQWGLIRLGRPLSSAAAAAKGHNETSIAVCVVGQYSTKYGPHNGPYPAPMVLAHHRDQHDAVISLLTDLCRQFKLDPFVAIKGHKELSGQSTACPGDINLDELRADVARTLVESP